MLIRPSHLVLPWAAGLAACTTSSTGEAVLDIDEQAILSSLADFRESPAFVPVNQTTYETALGTGAAINVFVAAHAFDSYSKIAADASGSGATVPEDTLIIREVLDGPGGKVKTLTLMYKGPPGYNPDLADFWFGVTSPTGAVIEENGVRKAGLLRECYACHLTRAQDGYLFGVPAANRPGVTPPEQPPPMEEPPVEPPAPSEPVCGDFSCDVGENCAVCEYDCQACPPDDDEDDDHGGGDDDHDEDDDDHGGGGHGGSDEGEGG